MSMIETGKVNELRVVRRAEQGYYLEDNEMNDVLLPNNSVPDNIKIGDILNVFVYRDSEDRQIATTQTPLSQAGDFVCLEVAETSQIGAFLDWGLVKDLFVPFSEQKSKMRKGQRYVVYVFVDEKTDRIVASSKIDHFLNHTAPDYIAGQQVWLLIADETDLGYKAIINNRHIGILYENEVFQALRIGQKITGFIKKIRPDGKIDLLLQRPGNENADKIQQTIIEKLRRNDGFLPVSDHSQPEVIYAMFGCSKKNFKKAVGALYKKRIIELNESGIRITQ